MIHYVSTRRHDYTIRELLAGEGAALADRLRLHAYETLLDAAPTDLPAGTWVFTDYDRLGPDDSRRAAQVWRRLADRGCRMLNHPTRSLRRFALLRALRARGLNDFDVRPIDDLRPPARWPVFIRRADAHSGPASQLLRDTAALERTIAGMRRRGWPLHAFVMVEFADSRERDGRYRKYGAVKIGDAVVAQHKLASDDWIARRGSQGVWGEAEIAEETRYVEENPHRDRIAVAFAVAGIDYGRIDYGIQNGRMQVWEINSNPSFTRGGGTATLRQAATTAANAAILRALASLADDAPGGRPA